MKRLTAQWVRKAEDDIVGARSLEQSKPPLNDLICFHCQQSAEKYLKALVQESGSRSATHILTTCSTSDFSFRATRRSERFVAARLSHAITRSIIAIRAITRPRNRLRPLSATRKMSGRRFAPDSACLPESLSKKPVAGESRRTTTGNVR